MALGRFGVESVTVRDEDPVLRPIGEYLAKRATTLLNNQPDLSSFLKQDETTPGDSGGFTFKATSGRRALDGGFVRDGVRGEVTGSHTSSDSGDMKFVLSSFGVCRTYSENVLAGAMLQFDFADHDLDAKAGTVVGTGLLAPTLPRVTVLGPLYFEGASFTDSPIATSGSTTLNSGKEGGLSIPDG